MQARSARCVAPRRLRRAKLNLNETRAGELAILATEVSRNVLIHGGGGQVIIAGLENPAWTAGEDSGSGQWQRD